MRNKNKILFRRSFRKKEIFSKFLRFIIICLIFLNYYYNQRITDFFVRINFIKECNKIEDYLELCNNKLIKLKHIKKYNKPKISIVSPVHNRGKYILRFIKSIQNQKFKEIEIILIDDNSTDNTNSLIF